MAWGKKKHRPSGDQDKTARSHAQKLERGKTGPQPKLTEPVPKVKRPTAKKVVPKKADTPEPDTSPKTWLKKKRQK